MVRDHTDGHILFLILSVLCTCELTYFIPDCLNGIYIKNRIYILHYRSQTLQSHSCVNIFLL